MTTKPRGQAASLTAVAWPRPYVSLAAAPPISGGQGGYPSEYETTRAPVIRAAVWMFYRNQERTP